MNDETTTVWECSGPTFTCSPTSGPEVAVGHEDCGWRVANAGAQAMQAPEPAPVPPEVWVVRDARQFIWGVFANREDAVACRDEAGIATIGTFPVQGAPTPDPLPEGVVLGPILPAGVKPPEGIKVRDNGLWRTPNGVANYDRWVRLVESPASTPERVPLNESLGRTHADGWVIGALLLLDGEPVAADDGDMNVFTHASFDGKVSVLPLEGEA